MNQSKKISRDFLVSVISAYAEPTEGEFPCVPHVVDNTLEVLEGLGLLINVETAELILARKLFKRPTLSEEMPDPAA